jgi:hypothetical protein
MPIPQENEHFGNGYEAIAFITFSIPTNQNGLVRREEDVGAIE